jgi:hypothetical protein
MRTIHWALLAVACLFLLANCQPGATQPVETGPASGSPTSAPTPEEATIEDPTPAATVEDSTLLSPLSTPGSGSEGTAFQSPLPAPSEEPIEPPAPASQDVGVATGIMLGGNPPLPGVGMILRLADVLVDSDGTPLSASLNKETAPTTLVGGSGQFIFTDVPPGRYAIVVDLISTSVVLRDPASGDDLLVDVTGGEITDIGKLIYPDLPSLVP